MESWGDPDAFDRKSSLESRRCGKNFQQFFFKKPQVIFSTSIKLDLSHRKFQAAENGDGPRQMSDGSRSTIQA